MVFFIHFWEVFFYSERDWRKGKNITGVWMRPHYSEVFHYENKFVVCWVSTSCCQISLMCFIFPLLINISPRNNDFQVTHISVTKYPIQLHRMSVWNCSIEEKIHTHMRRKFCGKCHQNNWVTLYVHVFPRVCRNSFNVWDSNKFSMTHIVLYKNTIEFYLFYSFIHLYDKLKQL